MTLRISILLSIFLIGSSFQEIKLKKTKVADGITINLPENFFPMAPRDVAQRYPSVRKPLAAYTNNQMLIDFSINQSATQWRGRDIEIAKSFLKASVMNMFDTVQFIQEDIKEINGHNYVVFEIVTQLSGEKNSIAHTTAIRKYSYLQYLIINGKMYVFSIHAPIQLKDKWEEVAMEMMNSIKISKKI